MHVARLQADYALAKKERTQFAFGSAKYKTGFDRSPANQQKRHLERGARFNIEQGYISRWKMSFGTATLASRIALASLTHPIQIRKANLELGRSRSPANQQKSHSLRVACRLAGGFTPYGHIRRVYY